jgi:hypothetical protein
MFTAVHLHSPMRCVMSFHLPVAAVCRMVLRLLVPAVILRLFMSTVLLMTLCSSFVFRVGRGVMFVPVLLMSFPLFTLL